MCVSHPQPNSVRAVRWGFRKAKDSHVPGTGLEITCSVAESLQAISDSFKISVFVR